MNEKNYVYLVMGGDGSEFSGSEWIVATYLNKEEAANHATKANEELARLIENETPYLYGTNNRWNKYDLTEWHPACDSSYWVESLVLTDSVAQFLNTEKE